MSSSATTVADYLAELDPARRAEISAVRDLVNAALPAGYREGPADFIALYERVKPR